ncbi:MAG: response regulator transcription factor [Saprospiraceae bacterium]|nr:response regulator transcription factor [Saprospiraceae bacterium]
MPLANILYVEDDQSLAYITKDHLEMNDYNVVHCEDGESAKKAFNEQEFDLCIFDVMLPKTDGFALCEYVRKTDPHIPVIMLTAKSLKEDKITGLKTGADDYITKPFSIEELILKIQIFLRRNRISSPKENDIITIGDYTFDPKNLALKHPKNDRILTQRESELLKVLTDNMGNVLKRSDILNRIWGEDDYFLGRSLDVFISRLRKYLSEDERISIENIHSVGFKLSVNKNDQ